MKAVFILKQNAIAHVTFFFTSVWCTAVASTEESALEGGTEICIYKCWENEAEAAAASELLEAATATADHW